MKKNEGKSLKQIRVTVRFTEKEFKRLEFLAVTYAGGNIAKWVRHAAIEGERKFLK